MPAKKREGMTALYAEIPDEMMAELEEFVARYPIGGKADHLRLALRRHMDSPPTVAVPRLPPIEVEAPPLRRRAQK